MLEKANSHSLQRVHSPLQIEQAIVAAREDSGLTQTQVAEKVCLTRQTVARYESQVSIPESVKNLIYIARAIGLEIYVRNANE